jgi:uncharacterized membrane protein
LDRAPQRGAAPDVEDRHHRKRSLTAILDHPSAGTFGTVATGINDVGQIVGLYFEKNTVANNAFGDLVSLGFVVPW